MGGGRWGYNCWGPDAASRFCGWLASRQRRSVRNCILDWRACKSRFLRGSTSFLCGWSDIPSTLTLFLLCLAFSSSLDSWCSLYYDPDWSKTRGWFPRLCGPNVFGLRWGDYAVVNCFGITAQKLHFVVIIANNNSRIWVWLHSFSILNKSHHFSRIPFGIHHTIMCTYFFFARQSRDANCKVA